MNEKITSVCLVAWRKTTTEFSDLDSDDFFNKWNENKPQMVAITEILSRVCDQSCTV